MDSLFILDTHGTETINEKIDILYDAKEEVGENSTAGGENNSCKGRQRTGRRFSSVKRYHEIEKFSLYKPGQISSELRKALNLGKHDIPIHVYRMRSLGYPPGWLNKARVEDLPSFNEEKHEVSTIKYKVEEIIEYPGFNVFSSKLRESCQIFGCPPIQRHHLIQNFIGTLQQRTGHEDKKQTEYVRELSAKDLDSLEAERQRILAEINNLKAQSSSVQDVSPIDLNVSSPQSDSRPISVSSGETIIFSDSSSPDLAPTEEAQEPDQTTVSTNAPMTSTAVPIKTIPIDLKDQQSQAEEQSATDEEEKLMAEEEKIEEASEELAAEEEQGTTIPISFQSSSNLTGGQDSVTEGCCEKRPRIEAFSAGIQPFLPFDNLPGTQGTYIRVRDSLKRARSLLGSSCQTVGDTAFAASTSPTVQKAAPQLEPKKVGPTSTYSESRQTTVVDKTGWRSERVETNFTAPPPPSLQDTTRWSYRKSSSDKSSWRLQEDEHSHSSRHRDDRDRDCHSSRGNYYQDERYSGHYRDSHSDRSRSSHNDYNRNPSRHYSGHNSRGDTAGRDSHRNSYNSHSRSPFSLTEPPRRRPEYSTQAPYHPYW